MQKYLLILVLNGVLLSNMSIYAATTASATVTYTISSIDSITVSGNPAAFTINTATAGSSPTAVTDNSTTYAVTTNNTARKVTGAVSTAMPSGTTLGISLAAPTGATSAGNINMTTTAQSLVTAIANIAQASLVVNYTFTATLSASQVSAATNTVTYTVGP